MPSKLIIDQGLMVGQQSILSTAGPMAASARDLGLFMKVMSDGQPWLSDHTAHRIPWRPEDLVMIGQGQPRIGIMWDDGIVKPLPPMRRAMEMTVKKLKEAGLEVVDVQPFKTVENWDIAVSRHLIFVEGRLRCGSHGATSPTEENESAKLQRSVESLYVP